MVPHAAWRYSGAVAGETYAEVVVPRLVVLLGPNHRGPGQGAAVMSGGAWEAPGGRVPIAADLGGGLLDVAAELRDDPGAHRGEHSLEVQVPFLRYRRPDLAIVPIVLYTATVHGRCAMREVSVAEARQRFRALLDEVAAGAEVAVLRRGKEVARLVPPRRRQQRLPSLAVFRNSIGVRGESLSATVIRARREARY